MVDYKIEYFEDKETLMVLLIDKSNSIVIGKLDGTIDTPTEIYITIGVNQKYQRQGYSKKLFELLFNKLKEPKYMLMESVVLDVMPINNCDVEWLTKYYEKIGFQTKNIYPNCSEVPHMVYYL